MLQELIVVSSDMFIKTQVFNIIILVVLLEQNLERLQVVYLTFG
jgi:hypothetical protein